MPLFTLLLLALTPRAHAFTTRVHIALANDVRSELLASPDGRTVRLAGSEHHVRLKEEDARAVREWPLAFRAGAVGPDNFVFPAMTDLTHAVGLRPYDQCEDLYQLAQTDQERAYAMGCFLHGASDAVAHHYVNGMTGETFTLNPITANRDSDFDNVVRHIVAESMIQEAWMEAFPEAFTTEALLHAIPTDFVMRTVLDPTSPVWIRMTTHALPKWEAVQAADPDALVAEQVAALDVAPAEHLALLPLYVEKTHIDLDLLVGELGDLVVEMQDPSEVLGVGPGDDGVLGTEDDTTVCSVTCPTEYGTYFTLIALLEPIPEEGGSSAAELIIADLHDELDRLVPAYVQTISETSALLNGAIDPDGGGAGIADLDPTAAFTRLTEWADGVADIDWEVLIEAIAPGWLLDLEAFLDAIGINLDLAGLLQTLIQPEIDAINEAVTEIVIEEVEEQIDTLTEEIEAFEGAYVAEFEAELLATAPDGAGGTILDDLANSGLYMHSFNLVAATLAEHQMVLPTGDEHAGIGAATFDASHTLAWTQAASCYPSAILPLGLDRAALLSIRRDGQDFRSTAPDSPIECHSGNLGAFSDTPDSTNCALTDLDTLMSSSSGSLSRAYPPDIVGVSIPCDGIAVDGLPAPAVSTDPDAVAADADGKGCGCATGGAPSSAWIWLVLLALVSCKRSTETDSDPGTAPGTTPPIETDGTWSATTGWELIHAIGDTTWHARADLGEGERVYELSFDPASRLVAEIRNPWGPGRLRTLRSFTPTAAGLETIVTTPAGWEPNDDGSTEIWDVSIEGAQLVVVRNGVTATFDPGPEPAPTSGLTAIARAFESDGLVDEAFCISGAGGFDYQTLFDFARGGLNGELVAEEIVGGAQLDGWYPTGGDFALADLPDFDRDGGTAVYAPENWMVRYTGTFQHPGGQLNVRERNDSVEDGIWVWLDDNVGAQTNGLALEVHGFLWPDATPDVGGGSYPAGDVPVEVLVVRCGAPIEDVELEVSVGAGWISAGDVPATLEISETMFPSTF